jgi:hypothetical protein
VFLAVIAPTSRVGSHSQRSIIPSQLQRKDDLGFSERQDLDDSISNSSVEDREASGDGDDVDSDASKASGEDDDASISEAENSELKQEIIRPGLQQVSTAQAAMLQIVPECFRDGYVLFGSLEPDFLWHDLQHIFSTSLTTVKHEPVETMRMELQCLAV